MISFLDLESNKITDLGARAFAQVAQAIAHSQDLFWPTGLSVGHRWVDIGVSVCVDPPAVSFGFRPRAWCTDRCLQALQNTPNLSHLYLGSNVIEDKGATALGDAAKVTRQNQRPKIILWICICPIFQPAFVSHFLNAVSVCDICAMLGTGGTVASRAMVGSEQAYKARQIVITGIICLHHCLP